MTRIAVRGFSDNWCNVASIVEAIQYSHLSGKIRLGCSLTQMASRVITCGRLQLWKNKANGVGGCMVTDATTTRGLVDDKGNVVASTLALRAAGGTVICIAFHFKMCP